MEEGDKNTSPHQSTPTTVEGFNNNPEGILVKDYEFVKPQLDEADKDTSLYDSTPMLHHDFDKSPEATLDKIDTSVHEARDVCDSTNIEAAAEIIENTSMAECEKPILDEQINSEVYTHEAIFGEGKSQPDLRDSQITIPDELLPSLNQYVNLERSIIVHPSANKEQTPVNVSRIKRPSKFKESPFTTKFDLAEGFTEVQTKKFKQKYPFVSHPILDIEDTKVTNKFMTWLSVDLLKYHAKKVVLAVHSIDDPTLNVGGKEYHLNEYISGFPMHAVVPWHTVDHMFILINIKSKHHWVLAKGIDIDNHQNYKLNDKHNLFDVYIMKDLPQQPCGSLDCGLYMITYAECLTFGGSVPKVNFDPDLLHTRYASMLWHYGTKK
ncbi:hypothetical protein FXO38_02143 [Capsicum annuum]|nr:hypothetical protein FXO38_02143 [Capsicum annuum]